MRTWGLPHSELLSLPEKSSENPTPKWNILQNIFFQIYLEPDFFSNPFLHKPAQNSSQELSTLRRCKSSVKDS